MTRGLSTRLTLFHDIDRIDASPARYGEDSFAFLDRASGVVWERIRSELDRWFSEYPIEHADDLCARFRSKRPDQHYGAWWELYLFHLLCVIGYDVEVHPEVAGETTRPDFALTGSDGRVYLEAATVFSGVVEQGRHGAREGWIMDAINKAHHQNFFVGLNFGTVGLERPSVSEITAPVIRWLDGLDPDVVAATYEAGQRLPEFKLSVRDWEITFSAIPVKKSARQESDRRLLGMGPYSGGYVNDREMLRKTFSRKRGRYGQLNAPFVLAVLSMSTFLEDTDVEQALFGSHAFSFDLERGGQARPIRQPDGFWHGEHGPRAQGVSAVLVGAGVLPWTCPNRWPNLWLNPWARHPVRGVKVFPTRSVAEDGLLQYAESSRKPHEILELPPEWPGPEPAFPE